MSLRARERTDRDALFTKAQSKIEAATVQLAKEKDADKITVTEIAERAGVSRHTFYEYYTDLPDLMEYILTRVTQDITERSLAAEEPEEILRIFLDEIEQDSAILSNVLASRYRAGVEMSLLTAMKRVITVLTADTQDPSISEQDGEFLIDMAACMVLGYLLEHGVRQDFDKEAICQKFLWLISQISKSVG